MHTALDIQAIRKDFPILHQTVHGRPLVYLDNGASTQKPQVVIDALVHHYTRDNANVHRGIHELSNRSTEAFEGARKKASKFINSRSEKEIIFTRGTTEAINLVANSWGTKFIKSGDVILLTEMEHHSNIVPWQMLAARTGAKVAYVPVTGLDGRLDLAAFEKMLTPQVKLFACTHISNTLGTINPVVELCARARKAGVVTLIDAAQSVGHRKVDVQEIGCDFMAFSGHKMCAPTGIGVLYGRAELLEAMPPWQGGGDMIMTVDYDRSTWNTIPHKFEAGTPNIADTIALGTAMDYLDSIGRDRIAQHDLELGALAFEKLSAIEGVKILGPDKGRAGLVSFVIDGVHAHDVVMIADQWGVALRGGHHCNQPLMKKFGLTSTSRASFYLYNTAAEVDALVDALKGIRKFFEL